MAAQEGKNQLLDPVPAELRGKVMFSQTVCSDCANCPVVHHADNGEVILTNDASEHAKAVLFKPQQWAEFIGQIKGGKIS